MAGMWSSSRGSDDAPSNAVPEAAAALKSSGDPGAEEGDRLISDAIKDAYGGPAGGPVSPRFELTAADAASCVETVFCMAITRVRTVQGAPGGQGIVLPPYERTASVREGCCRRP